jgi:hypothetical protein
VVLTRRPANRRPRNPLITLKRYSHLLAERLIKAVD